MRKQADGGIDESLSVSTFIRKSPFVEGLKTGIKAGLIGAGVGAGYGALTRRVGAKKGTITGALGGLLVGGLLGAAGQELGNRRSEADMSYHMRRLMGRHPGITLPPEMVARIAAEEEGGLFDPTAARPFESYR